MFPFHFSRAAFAFLALVLVLTSPSALWAQEPFRILVANDDGINAEGIKALVYELEKIASLTVVAPNENCSGFGHMITIGGAIAISEVKHDGKFFGYGAECSPASCVKVGLQLMDKKPDLVVSGINEGHNLGRIIYVSGTFNAAQEAVLNGVPGIALSLDRNKKALDYTIGAEFARELVTQLRQKGFPHNAVINVNIPNCTREELKGVLLTTLSEYQYREIWSKRKTPWGQTYFWQMVRGPMKPGDVGSDQWAVENNYISVNPVPIDIENRASMQFLKNAKLKFQGRDMIKSVRDVK